MAPSSDGQTTVPLPPFNKFGELPVGVYVATLSEIHARFGAETPRRRQVFFRLERIHAIARASGHLSRMVVFGSFVTSKADPNDVDVFLLMADTFDVTQMAGETRLLFDHLAAETHFGASVFCSAEWLPLMGSRRR